MRRGCSPLNRGAPEDLLWRHLDDPDAVARLLSLFSRQLSSLLSSPHPPPAFPSSQVPVSEAALMDPAQVGALPPGPPPTSISES